MKYWLATGENLASLISCFYAFQIKRFAKKNIQQKYFQKQQDFRWFFGADVFEKILVKKKLNSKWCETRKKGNQRWRLISHKQPYQIWSDSINKCGLCSQKSICGLKVYKCPNPPPHYLPLEEVIIFVVLYFYCNTWRVCVVHAGPSVWLEM